METKTQKAINLFKSKDFKGALKVFSTFKAGISKKDSAILKRGYECYVNPDFYTQLGKDPQNLINEALTLAYTLFIRGDSPCQ